MSKLGIDERPAVGQTTTRMEDAADPSHYVRKSMTMRPDIAELAPCLSGAYGSFSAAAAAGLVLVADDLRRTGHPLTAYQLDTILAYARRLGRRSAKEG